MRQPVKPPSLRPGSAIDVVAPASPVDAGALRKGCKELARLGYATLVRSHALARDGYFAGPAGRRRAALQAALAGQRASAVFCARGGYGTTCLLERLDPRRLAHPKIVLGYSDITLLQIFLWQNLGWITFYGPMVAAGFHLGRAGYDADSFTRAVTETQSGWSLDLRGDVLVRGEAEGVLLGGCLTLVQTTLGTPWELNLRTAAGGAILLLEDCGLKPYQVDRILMHLKQAGMFHCVRAVVLGEMPECDPAGARGVTVRDVFKRVLRDLGVPVVCGVPIGHTTHPMLTLPLGVRARLRASGAGRLDILEPAVSR